MEDPAMPFPTEGILPKTETGAAEFVQKNPAWDGRGVIVAIFDTGVDPGAAGLQVTSHGLPKVVDIVDCTGSGDVEMSEPKELSKDASTIVGLTGRTLTLGAWNCPTKKYHLGIKRAYELFPKPLVKRIKEERLKSFMENQRQAESAAQSKFSELESAKTDAQKKDKKDAETLLSSLSEQMEQYSDAGPVFDCIVFHDGVRWRAVIDSDCSGDLSKAPALTNFRDERQWSTLNGIPGTKSSAVLLNYAVNIYEEGKRLSIVVDAGSHGTHVAGIVAANFPDKPDLNGIAPGAQVVSCKIGDTRLGSMETGTGLIRALIVAKENKCDVINLSYGESYLYPDSGRFVQVASEFVNRHGIIFVSSAGNNGPALSTVGAPGGTTSAFIGVGAYVSPGMMEVEYSLREPLARGTNYTWSSRGPAIDGYWGVSVCAPGGAIAPVPTWTLQGKQLMNGTSMSSPNCAGGIALLLSALKAERVDYTPHSVRRAIENTAAPVEGIEPFAIGHGLLQLPRAYSYLRQHAGRMAANMPLVVSLPNGCGVGGGRARGVYLRGAHEVERPLAFQVAVAPQFHPDCDNAEIVAFEVELALRATVPWVQVAKQMVVNGQGGVHPSKGFEMVVDATQPSLGPGAHFAMVQGFDPAAPGRGPLMEVPVTVIKPERVPDDGEYRFKVVGRRYAPGCIDRHFLHVPEGATWAQFTFRTQSLEASHMLVLHTLQLLPGAAATGRNRSELERYLRLKPHHEVVERVAVTGGLTMEVCVCKWWASVGACAADFEVEFHGVVATPRALTVTSAAPERLTVHTPLRAEALKVSAKATHLRKFYTPSKTTLRALDAARHQLPHDGRLVYELELHYSVEQTEKEAVKCQPRPQGLFDLLYDSPLESQMWMIFDTNKQLMGAGDALHDYPVTLPKGKYSLRLSLRHDDRGMLDKLKALVMSVDFALAKEISVTVYPSLHATVAAAGTKYTGGTSAAGERTVLYVAPPTDRAPGSKPGDVLVGAVTVAKAGDYGEEVGLTCLVGKEEEAEEAKDDEPVKTDAELLAEAVRDAQLGRLKKLREDKKWEIFDQLAAQVAQEHPRHLPLLKEVLLRAAAAAAADEPAAGKEPSGDATAAGGAVGAEGALQRRRALHTATVTAALAVIEACGADAMAAHYGVRYDKEDAAQKAVRKDMEARKEALIEAALCRAEALAELLEPAPGRAAADGGDGPGGGGKSAMEELEEAWGVVKLWVVPKEAKLDVQVRYAVVGSAVERRTGRPGSALAELLRVWKGKEGAPNKNVLLELQAVAKQMRWTHWESYYAETLLKCFPAAYPLF